MWISSVLVLRTCKEEDVTELNIAFSFQVVGQEARCVVAPGSARDLVWLIMGDGGATRELKVARHRCNPGFEE